MDTRQKYQLSRSFSTLEINSIEILNHLKIDMEHVTQDEIWKLVMKTKDPIIISPR